MKKSMLAVFVSAVLVMAGCGSFGVSAMDQKTTEHVESNDWSEVTNVWIVIDGRSAAIDRDFTWY